MGIHVSDNNKRVYNESQQLQIIVIDNEAIGRGRRRTIVTHDRRDKRISNVR